MQQRDELKPPFVTLYFTLMFSVNCVFLPRFILKVGNTIKRIVLGRLCRWQSPVRPAVWEESGM